MWNASDGITIKTFGTTEEQVAGLIREYCRFKTITVTLVPEVLEVTVKIQYSPKVTKNNIDYVTGGIYQKLKDFIYADYDTTLSKKVLETMRQREKKLAVAESVTGGMLSSMLIANKGASRVFYEGITAYDSQAKINRLGVNPDTIAAHGAVSIETVYEMAAGLLETGQADVVAATSGYAEADDAKNNGLCFIAIGDVSGIHVYRHKFWGPRDIIRESAAKTALYYLLKYFTHN